MNAKKKSKKKKKASQSKPAAEDDAVSNAEETVEHVQNLHSASEENQCFKTSGSVDVQIAAVSESDLESERHKICEEKFAMLNEIIERLEEEKILRGQRENRLEERITHLQNDVCFCIQNYESLREKLNNVQNESISLTAWQVTQLEKSRLMDIQENQRLTETISGLESRIQLLEKELSPPSKLKVTKPCCEQQPEVVAGVLHNMVMKNNPPVSPAMAPPGYASPKRRDDQPDPNEGIGMAEDALYRLSNGIGEIGGPGFGAPMFPLGHLGEPDDPWRSEEIVHIPLDDTPVRGADPRPPWRPGKRRQRGCPCRMLLSSVRPSGSSPLWRALCTTNWEEAAKLLLLSSIR